MLDIVMQASPSAPNPIGGILPIVLIFIIFWFVLLRPQQKRQKAHVELLKTIARGDTVVTNGGIIGKVTKTTDDELTIEVAEGTRIRVLRGMIADVRGRPEVAANDSTKTNTKKKSAKK